jgi:hypothetical protein
VKPAGLWGLTGLFVFTRADTRKGFNMHALVTNPTVTVQARYGCNLAPSSDLLTTLARMPADRGGAANDNMTPREVCLALLEAGVNPAQFIIELGRVGEEEKLREAYLARQRDFCRALWFPQPVRSRRGCLSADVVTTDDAEPETNELLVWALKYAKANKPVFPCNPMNKKPLVKSDKEGEGGFKLATCDETVIRGWWARWPNAMIGMPTGAKSGLFVIDLDVEEGKPNGRRAYAELGYDEMATLASMTPRGGMHLFFTHRDGLHGTTGNRGGLAPGIDTRGDGGYVILPPSMRGSDGKRYEWRKGDSGRTSALPDALFERLRKLKDRDDEFPPREGGGFGEGGEGRRGAYALEALDDECKIVSDAPEGSRNDLLNIAAMKLGQLVAAGELGQAPVADALYGAAAACGLVKDDGGKSVRATIKSGLRKGMTQPRKIPDGDRRPPPGFPPGSPPADHVASDGDENRDPREDLNSRHAVIGSIGGKCRVMSWERVGGYDVPVFTSFDDFKNRYCNRYIGDKRLGHAWLSWPQRREYAQLVFEPHDERRVIDGCFKTMARLRRRAQRGRLVPDADPHREGAGKRGMRRSPTTSCGGRPGRCKTPANNPRPPSF